jgi:hypothetical protein
MTSCPDRTHHNRRGWLLGCALLAAFAASGYAQGASPAAQAPGKTVDEIRNLRREIAARPRPLVIHGDGRPMDPALDELEKGSPPLIFPHLPGTHTSALTYSLIHQFNVARLYRSRVAQEWPAGYVQKLYGDGPDGLQRYIDFCRQQGYEAWFAMRANDTHDGSDNEHGRMRWESNPYKQRHPEWLHGTRDQPPPFGRWSAMDYARPEVREQVFRLLQEVCQNYDIDGIQLDFNRHLNIFKSVAWGGEVSEEEVQMITGLMRRLRRMMDEEGARRGRPILFCVRTPDSTDYARAVGLDVETWMQQGLIDVWAIGGYFQLQDLAVSVRVARRYHCQVWATMDRSALPLTSADPNTRRNWQESGVNSVEGYRGRAMLAWHAGVNSIDLFNFFVVPGQPHFGLLTELGDPKKLAWLDKLYVPDPLGNGRAGRWLKDGDRFFNRPVFAAGPLTRDKSRTVYIPVADDLPAAPANRRKASVTLDVVAQHIRAPGDLVVRFNDTTLSPIGQDLTYRVDPAIVKRGDNGVTLTLTAGADGGVHLEDLRLWIRYEPVP